MPMSSSPIARGVFSDGVHCGGNTATAPLIWTAGAHAPTTTTIKETNAIRIEHLHMGAHPLHAAIHRVRTRSASTNAPKSRTSIARSKHRAQLIDRSASGPVLAADADDR